MVQFSTTLLRVSAATFTPLSMTAIRKPFNHMVNDGLTPNLLVPILNSGIIQFNLNKDQ